jgi:8-amino-7-oxononanoate synthase
VFHVKPGTPPALGFLDQAIADLQTRGLLRTRPLQPSRGTDFCSNDYLGLADRRSPPEASGAGASRLVSGERSIHAEIEAAAAALVDQECALVFTSGYAANVGALAALAAPGDVIASDELNHASIIDGARLSRARVAVFPHKDAAALERILEAPRSGRAWVATESYFSMDADSPDLARLRALCDRHEAGLYVDEAHALGVLGPSGRGLCFEAGIAPDVLVGTFGKAFGAGGAFVAGSPALVTWLWNRARSFVFSTGLSPVVAKAALAGIRASLDEPGLRPATLARAAQLRHALAPLPIRILGYGHIIPWLVGDAAQAMFAAKLLAERGIDVRAIRPPSVPDGTARLRFTVSAKHTERDVDLAAAAISQAIRLGVRCLAD